LKWLHLHFQVLLRLHFHLRMHLHFHLRLHLRNFLADGLQYNTRQ
jgi:hypothetical protein